jgi:phospholipid-binding lipoprotein MlaA
MTNCWTRFLLVALLLTGAAGCATTGGGDPRDPLEGFNRAMYSFNDGFDQAIGKPIATVYHDAVPEPARMMVRNLFANVADLWIGANNLMQGKPLDAMTDWTRFAVNSTFGLFGLLDFASDMGIEKHDEDFGQTMGRWGMDDGAYLVWPFIGSSTLRDSVGLVPDLWIDPVWGIHPHSVRYFAAALRAVGKRADLLDASRILEEAALDKYVFQRDAYLQRRKSLIYDGNPPRVPRLIGSDGQPHAQGEMPPADEAPVAASVPAPQSLAPAFEAAAQLLEQPAWPAAARGG